jgi:VanZ family protein
MPATARRAGDGGALPRRPWLRALALTLGAVVLLAHIVTLRDWIELPAWWQIDWPDIAKHAALISAFTLAYRLSFRGSPRGADIVSILICSGWAGLCEALQHWIPARDFSIYELAANTLTPVAVVGILRLLLDWRRWFS